MAASPSSTVGLLQISTLLHHFCNGFDNKLVTLSPHHDSKLCRPTSIDDTLYKSELLCGYCSHGGSNLFSAGFTECTALLVLRPLQWTRKNSQRNRTIKEETSGRATEKRSLSQDGQTCKVCCVYRFKDTEIKT